MLFIIVVFIVIILIGVTQIKMENFAENIYLQNQMRDVLDSSSQLLDNINIIKPMDPKAIQNIVTNKYNNSTMKIINSLWTYHVPYVKINPLVIKYLDKYSSYATNMNNNLISNKKLVSKRCKKEWFIKNKHIDVYNKIVLETNFLKLSIVLL